MPTARVVRSRGRQIIVLPKGISLTTAKVDVQRKGGEIVVRDDVLDEAIFLGAPASLPTMRSFGGR